MLFSNTGYISARMYGGIVHMGGKQTVGVISYFFAVGIHDLVLTFPLSAIVSDRGLIKSLSWNLPAGTEGNHEELQSG
jgi:hypothetical protein